MAHAAGQAVYWLDERRMFQDDAEGHGARGEGYGMSEWGGAAAPVRAASVAKARHRPGPRALVLVSASLICVFCLALTACGGNHAQRLPAPTPSAPVHAAQPTATPTYAQAAQTIAETSGASGSVRVTVAGTAITVRDEIGDQPDISSARNQVFAEAFAIQRGLWESLLHPSSVTVIVSASTVAGVPQSAPLGECTLTESKDASVLWTSETPLDAWAYVYDTATLANALKP